MKAAYLYTLRKLRGQAAGWGLALAAFALLIATSTSLVRDNAREFTQLIEKLPPGIVDFLGTDAREIATPAGFLDVRFFTLAALIAGFFGVLTGSGLFAADEESGRLDLLLAYPVRRRDLFLGRLLALLTVTLGILAASWLGIAAGLFIVNIDLDPFSLLPAFASLLALVLVFQWLALLLSLVLPSRSAAGMAAGMVLVASFILTGLSRINPNIALLANLLPIAYYQGGEAVKHFHPGYLAGLLAAAAAFAAAAYWRFEVRDIRVAGEGTMNWQAAGAVAAAAALLAAAVAWMMTWEAKADSPEEAFAKARTAVERKDWDKLCQALTPDALDDWTGRMALVGLGLQKLDPAAAGTGGLPIPAAAGVNPDGLLPFLLEGRMAMAHVDEYRLGGYAALLPAVMLGAEPDPQKLKEMAGLVDDRAAFTAKMLKALSYVKTLEPGDSIRDVKTDGDTATALLVGPGDQTRPVTFRRLNGGWKVDLPFPVSMAR